MHDETRSVQRVQLSYGKAINAALSRALAEMPDTILYGEDLAKPGGVFGVTKNLQNEAGAVRVFDTPISETAMLGAAVGAAMCGLRPIVEIMWIDFSLVAMDQIVNQAANVRYVSAGRLAAPLTIRTQQGATPGSCAQHSQNLEAMFAHVPGLRVGLPATAQDAYSMLLAAIRSDDPTLIIENRGLYHGDEQSVAIDGPIEAVGGAHVARAGSDLTIVSWGAMLGRALEAAALLEAQGVSVEVVNARWIAPFDWDTLLASVRRTGALMVVHEANLSGGFGAEIAARVQGALFGQLRAPVERLGVADCRMPSAPHLQAALIPDAADIARRAQRLTRVM
ncbi:alpha-ketoacid dehydrogenase subunit beta [Variovorax ginsengisoli]|uniref:Transketolase C-terminal domain-containing protein n=1 Tax=Variovorax ginsengisoli TaxID=363844 RepID=A0ABT8SCX4_9BURK|nr:transketolase C-terminal domain-containing protein [Variovorax ginsengisoli]MDN8616872.1 transketolase C-terminal domain-containing protein [Variovorax ginsengisoli]MDO1536042.1 transketolase C-terminal domain-containing protein [Variovorax ginsengisoli]